MDKHEIGKSLERTAFFLELRGDNPFKARAYFRAALALRTSDEDVERLHREGQLTSIPGVGKSIARDIGELMESGKLTLLEELEAEFPSTIMELFSVPGLGSKRIKDLYEQLNIRTIGELEYACRENRLASLRSFGSKSQENIIEGIEKVKRYQKRRLRADCEPLAQAVLEDLRSRPEILRVSVAGSLRRGLETVKDIDIVAASDEPAKIAQWFSERPFVESLIGAGETKVSVTMKGGVNLDLRLVKDGEFPYALQYLTGSKAHNEDLRGLARKMGYKLNEYGLFRGEELVVCRTEEDIYRALGLDLVEPELREAMGEIEAAQEHRLPSLIGREDIKGVFHMHTRYSDGSGSLEEMAEAAERLGFSYLGISEHSRSAAYAGGLKVEAVERMRKDVDAFNSSGGAVHLFFGIESDISPGGDLDYPVEVLELFDFVIASVHSRFDMSREEMTERMVKAVENPYTTMLGHPTGRLLLAREAYPLDLEKVLKKAAETGVIVEFNSHPQRLDLDWRLLPLARKLGVKTAINPDAHSPEGLEDVFYGIRTARKGWLEPQDVINTLPLDSVTEILKSQRSRSARAGSN